VPGDGSSSVGDDACADDQLFANYRINVAGVHNVLKAFAPVLLKGSKVVVLGTVAGSVR
jgi:hypothetical protein